MKGKKNSKSSQYHEDKKDRISNLPDSLIHEILSSVDISRAVQTSVLSKRWKNTWKSLPFITVYWRPLKLISFVDNVFNFRDNTSGMKIFKMDLVICTLSIVQALNRWILAAVDHNVQVINITAIFSRSTAYEVPHQLLNCKSLKTLAISFYGVPSGRHIDIILPESMSLPQIKNLSLEGFSILNSELQRLLSSCPFIETVEIKHCDIQLNNQMNSLIDSHSLQTLRLVDNRYTHLGPGDNLLPHTTNISVPNVKNFMCTDILSEDLSVDSLSSIVSAHLRMRSTEKEVYETADAYSELSAQEKEVFAKRMMKFLEAAQKVHHLTLSSGSLEVLLEAPGTLYRQPPQLCNLETMNLEMRFTRSCFQSISYLLKISPIIGTLILISKESELADVGDDWEVEFSLACMSSHLKSVEIREVEGCDNEIKFLECLLKNSTRLQKLTLIFRSTSDSHDRERQMRRFKRNLTVLRAAYSNIQMNFCNL